MALLVGAWLLTYLIHSTVLLGGTALLAQVLGPRFDRFADTAWRAAMFGAVATSFAQLALFTSSTPLLVLEPGEWPPVGAHWSLIGDLLPALLFAWAVVALVRLVALARAYRALARAGANRVPLSDATIRARVRALSGDTVVRVSVSPTVLTPMVVGHGELCLPERAVRELSSAELDAVLAHEIAHIARHDTLWLTMAASVERVLFMQPLNAYAARRMRAVAECACDDWALARVGNSVALASALTRVAEWLAGAPAQALAVGMASRESLALARVRRILDPSTARFARQRAPLPALFAAVLLSAVVLLVPGVSAGSSLRLEAPAVRYTIRAEDDAGPFTLTLDHGRAVAATIDGMPVGRERLRQNGNTLHVTDPRGGAPLELTLTAGGGMRWTSRRAPSPTAR